MAHSSYVASIEQELTCCVCLELFVDPNTPKDLNCPHVICELCLNRLAKSGSYNSLIFVIECPHCRVITKLSKDGVAALKTNLSIRNLAEKHQKHLEKQKQQSHPSSQSKSQYNLVPVCPDHGEKMHFYCVTCDILVCRSCTVVDHKQPQHEIQDMKVLRREKMKLLDAKINKLEQVIVQYEKRNHYISETAQKIRSSIKTEEGKIDRAVALLVQKVYDQSDALKAEIRRKNDPKYELCQRIVSLQKQSHDQFQRIVTDARAVAEVSSSHNFLMRHKALMDKIKAIPVHSDVVLVQYQPGEVEFKAAQLALKLGTITVKQSKPSGMKSSNSEAIPGQSDEGPIQYQPREVEFNAEELALKLGTITVKQSKPSCVKRGNTVGLVRKIHGETARLEDFTMNICSMASNRSGDILAISESFDAVHIYCKQSNGQYKKQLSLNATGSQFDCGNWYVTIAADGKYLVTKGRSIHVYSTSGQYQRVCYTAPTHTNPYELRLSCITTTKDGSIIAGDYARSVITVHTPDGMTLLKTINTSIKPHAITAINNTHVTISNYYANKVCVIDLESGRETLSIDIDEPLAVCYDEETDCLLISRVNGEINQYSLLSGHLIASIGKDLSYPNAMIFTGGMLAVNSGMLAVNDGKAVKLCTTSV